MLIRIGKHLRTRGAQSTLEYAALIAVVAGAIIALNLYIRRSVQGNLRSSADEIGTQYDITSGGYHQVSALQAPEVTHSAMGIQKDRDVAVPNAAWRAGITVGRGSEVQWTETSAQRTQDEQVTTKGEANAVVGE